MLRRLTGGRKPQAASGSGATQAAGPSTLGGTLRPTVKVALVGDNHVGKTSLMVRYAEGAFEEHQPQTQGVNFMERSVSVQGNELTFSIWDIGGDKDNWSMLPLVCNDAAAILFMVRWRWRSARVEPAALALRLRVGRPNVPRGTHPTAPGLSAQFDLTRHETLDSIREWHRKARGLNKCAVPLLVGVKYDLLLEAPAAEHAHVEAMARRFAAAIDAPLVLCAPSVPINVTNIFKVRSSHSSASSGVTCDTCDTRVT